LTSKVLQTHGEGHRRRRTRNDSNTLPKSANLICEDESLTIKPIMH
jgi:hypothetical protein